MDYTQIKVNVDERVGVITLNHNPPRNSFTKRMLVEVLDALDEFEKNDIVRCVMLNSEGPNFSMGADFDDIDEEWSGEVHYSTARDLAKLSVCAMQNETFRAVVSSKSFTENGRSFTNHNKLLWRVDGADGIKTGYTKRAGRILAGSAVRDGRRLVCVTICDPDDWRDQQALFDYGFSAFSLQTLVREGDTVGSVPVVGGRLERVSLTAAEEISYPLAEGERKELVLHAPQLAFAPVLAGQAGWLELRVDGVCVREVPVYYAQAVEETRPARSFWKRMFGG